MSQTTPNTSTTAEEVVRALDDRINAHDLEGATDLWADDATLVWPADVFTGKPEIRAAFDQLLTAQPDYHQETDQFVVEGDTVACETRATGTFSGGPLGGFEPTGAEGTIHMVKLYTVEDGLLVRGRVYYDQMEFAREMGLLPEEDSTGDRVMTQMLNTVTRVRDHLDRARAAVEQQ